jgi:hypothetical protein
MWLLLRWLIKPNGTPVVVRVAIGVVGRCGVVRE